MALNTAKVALKKLYDGANRLPGEYQGDDHISAVAKLSADALVAGITALQDTLMLLEDMIGAKAEKEKKNAPASRVGFWQNR